MRPDFERDRAVGQMLPKEREAMYNEVVKRTPSRMLEIGTWKGGGSTYILACAALQCGSVLDTIEADEGLYKEALSLYRTKLDVLRSHVVFHHGLSHDIIPRLLEGGPYDFVLFDGAENAEQTVREYDLLNHHLPLGGLIACHDWMTEKMRLLKEVLANDNTWGPVCVMEDTDTGFAMFGRAA